MDQILASIAAKKMQLDKLRPLPPEALANLEHYYDVEITYTSNAIEGNTLSPVETTLVIEKGITISGKPLKDHLEALDHYDAMRYIREIARETAPLTESDISAICTGLLCSGPGLTLPDAMPILPVTFAPRRAGMCFLHRRRFRRSWATWPPGSDRRSIRRKRRSRRIASWWIFTPSMTA